MSMNFRGQFWKGVWKKKKHFWSETGSGFGEPGGPPPPRIPRSNPLAPRLVVLTTLPKVKPSNILLIMTSSSSHKAWVIVWITVCSAHRIILPGAVKSTFAARQATRICDTLSAILTVSWVAWNIGLLESQSPTAIKAVIWRGKVNYSITWSICSS